MRVLTYTKLRSLLFVLVIALTELLTTSLSAQETEPTPRLLSKQATFGSLLPQPNGCVLVFGSFSPADQNFLLRSCGSRFEVQNIGFLGHFEQVQSAGRNSAWAVVSGSLMRVRFSEQRIKVSRKLHNGTWRGVFFIDSRTGWVCGSNGMIMTTADSGKTWAPQVSGTDVELRQIRFADPDFGWAIGYENRGGVFLDVFLITRDGGRSWHRGTLPHAKSFDSASFAKGFNGCGLVDVSTAYCTRGGSNWTRVTIPNRNSSEIVFLDRDIGYVFGETISRTTDGGRTWRNVLNDHESRPFSFLDDAVFLDSKIGYAWSPQTVFKTEDGGQTWHNISSLWFVD